MKIIILGAGQVGGTLAENLSSEKNDITIIDTDTDRLRELQDRIDVKTVYGHGSFPHVLRDAGADDADMLVAVTNSDETNMVACQVAYTLFRTPTKISRIRSNAYLKQTDLFNVDAFPIDVLISPEQVVTKYIRRLLEFPGALQVLDFADGKVQLVAVRAYYGGPLVGQAISTLKDHLPNVETRVAAVFRRNTAIEPKGDTVIEADDEVFFIAGREHIHTVMSELRRAEDSYKRVIIAGGGNIGYRLAKALEKRYRLKIIEHNPERARYLSENLDRTVVLHGSGTDKSLLEEENIENTDVFCALTNDDEVNIMASLLAKRHGARKVMTLINKAAYVDLVQGGMIDVAISPQQATIGSLLTHVRRGDVVNVHSLRRGAAEAIEAIAHGDSMSSKVVGRRVGEIKLPPGTTIGAIVRGDDVIMGRSDVVVESDDHVILFVMDKRHIADVERLFQVGLGFF
ncbi:MULTISPECIES: Trk system potassium transporter TrkA [Thalassolituus]|jgi:trk system potassium uptake protein TrkA|uniref:Trk system potassium transporter TrkA n=2 Tax=Oceanospirillaceae TaxID=135620 RepID=UPI0007CFC7A4|nr:MULTISPECIES: Trk system potassium transporter TrkA [Thalassolituus]KZZ12212.1 potassium transporter peripheral membrane component [Oleibacter sp. HI0075]MAG43764.1 Trk system potassium transporter TrkA [Oceanospirillaceae bacterium]MEE3209582.1 Trk system potassium transporter TrkA [Pseudomonadota bacterium]HCG77936.1 Trk system potassium transporter TrkA [Oceanospirillales bacterium]TPD54748.1 MAG: Trk system potassium transporter TrkA [Thalassolituus maritimus]|tara:strand:- start:99969 stop:101342 length:1374 start_codon:yes stop_codon:yes gene_type:complete